MSNTSHTPGPWHRDGFNLSSIIRLQYPIGHPECKHTTGTYETIARCEGDNWDANSRLIAAAPELLEALQDMFEQYADMLELGRGTDNENDKAIMDNARAAIAKATGKE